MDPIHLAGGHFTRYVVSFETYNVSLLLHCGRWPEVIADDLDRYIFRLTAQILKLQFSRQAHRWILSATACDISPMIRFPFILYQMSEKKLLKSCDWHKMNRAVAAIRKNKMGLKKPQKRLMFARRLFGGMSKWRTKLRGSCPSKISKEACVLQIWKRS